jgi:hypothetical protein
MSVDFTNRGSPEKCFKCGSGPAERLGWNYYCQFHRVIQRITDKASSGKILVIKNGEYWDYRHDLMFEFVESTLMEYLSGRETSVRDEGQRVK